NHISSVLSINITVLLGYISDYIPGTQKSLSAVLSNGYLLSPLEHLLYKTVSELICELLNFYLLF
ncbi:MAG: hypothetical protein D4R73_00535, partial [Deltaproteobacteria bacterium]